MRKQGFIIAIAIAVIIGLCLLPSSQMAGAEIGTTSGTCGDGLTWELSDEGELTISGEGEMDDYSASSSAPWEYKKAR